MRTGSTKISAPAMALAAALCGMRLVHCSTASEALPAYPADTLNHYDVTHNRGSATHASAAHRRSDYTLDDDRRGNLISTQDTSADHQPSCTPGSTSLEEATMHVDTAAILNPTSANHQPSYTPDSTLLEAATMHGDTTTLLNPPPSVYWLLLALLFCLPPLILWNIRRVQHKTLAVKVCGLTRVQAHWRARMARKRLALWRRSATYIQAQS